MFLQAELFALGGLVVFTDGLQVSHYLTGMSKIGQRVDYRDRAELGKILHLLLSEGAYHKSVKIAGEHSCGVAKRLAASNLQVAG